MKLRIQMSAFIMAVFVFSLMAQPTQDKIDQALLLKKFEGTWHCEIGTDTSAIWDMEPYGIGYLASLKYVSKGKIIKEGRGVYGYDEKTGKIGEAGITRGMNIGIYSMWFVTSSKFILIPYIDLANPEKASFRMEGEFKDPDILVEKTIINNKTVKTKTWTNSKR